MEKEVETGMRGNERKESDRTTKGGERLKGGQTMLKFINRERKNIGEEKNRKLEIGNKRGGEDRREGKKQDLRGQDNA